MPSIGLFMISNNSNFLYKSLVSSVASGVFSEISVVIDSSDESGFANIISLCDRVTFDPSIGDPSAKGSFPRTSCFPNTDWILRLDDDETMEDSFARDIENIKNALATYGFDFYWLPRKWVWPTSDKFISSPRWYPDLQKRLFKRECKVETVGVHMPEEFSGSGSQLGYSILHHNLLWKSHEERMKRSEEYSSILGIATHDFLSGIGHMYFPEDIQERVEVDSI